ncbi:hypothetical protein [uncultured Bacteroides sp.]|uniref:hypothetical protein n=1 Tax=uncultured Bacteroides sp. TaxID=162156 RepID=UPI002AAB1410|nr:hypothetical protein [uncultured Bacteroides sp.]
MIKNNFISFKRFTLLYKKDFIENWKTMLLRFVMLYAIMAIIFSFIGLSEFKSRTNYNPSSVVTNYLIPATFLFWGFGCLFASLMMEKMKNKTKRIAYLMTPATNFEKFFSRFLPVVVVFIIAFVVAFKLADYTKIAILSIRYPEFNIAAVNITQGLCSQMPDAMTHNWMEFTALFSVYLFFQSLFILGSTLWYKNPFIKTLATGITITLLFFAVDGLLVNSFFNESQLFSVGDYFGKLMDKWATKQNIILFFSLLTLFNWVISYFRFKDSEIINRL